MIKRNEDMIVFEDPKTGDSDYRGWPSNLPALPKGTTKVYDSFEESPYVAVDKNDVRYVLMEDSLSGSLYWQSGDDPLKQKGGTLTDVVCPNKVLGDDQVFEVVFENLPKPPKGTKTVGPREAQDVARKKGTGVRYGFVKRVVQNGSGPKDEYYALTGDPNKELNWERI